MIDKERDKLQKEFDKTQKEIRSMQNMLNCNPSLLTNKEFQDKRTKLYYKSYCIDCTLHNVWACSYEQYLKGI